MKLLRRLLAFTDLAACGPMQTSRSASIGPGVPAAGVCVNSGSADAGVGTSGPHAAVDAVDRHRLKVPVGGGGLAASMRVGGFPVLLRPSPRRLVNSM